MSSFKRFLNKIGQGGTTKKGRQILIATGVLAYLGLFLSLSLARHNGLKTQMNDLGNLTQPLYNTLNGNFMKMSNYIVSEKFEISRFGVHANFILILLVPLYYLFRDPKLLLIIQTVLIGLGALPLYWLGEAKFPKKRKGLSLVAPFLYLVNPLVQDTNFYDFHPISVAMPLIIFAFYFAYRQRWFLFYFFSFLVLISKEDLALIVALLGLFLAFGKKRYKQGFFLFVFSILYFFFVVGYVIPFFAQESGLALVTQRYSYLGENIFEIIKTIISKPSLIISSLFQEAKIAYLFNLFLPLLFIPLLAPEILLLATPTLLINLLSRNAMMFALFQYYHSAPILAFLFLSLVFAIGRLKDRQRPALIAALIMTSLIYSWLLSPAPYSLVASFSDFRVSQHAKEIKKIQKMVPATASLTVQNNLGAHFAERLKVYSFPFNLETSDYILVDVNNPYPENKLWPRQHDFIFATQMYPEDYRQAVETVFNHPDYGVIHFSAEGYLLFKKNAGQDLNQAAHEMFVKNFEIIEAASCPACYPENQ